jgi:hypothetical protein
LKSGGDAPERGGGGVAWRWVEMGGVSGRVWLQ